MSLVPLPPNGHDGFGNELPALPAHRRGSKSWVYFIHARGLNALKIGVATNIENRLSSLRCACPVELVFLFALPGSFKYERELHSRFSHAHLRGEWFNLELITQEVLALSKTARAFHAREERRAPPREPKPRLRFCRHCRLRKSNSAFLLPRQVVCEACWAKRAVCA